jgi:3-phosphoglycerate kinase
MDLQVLGLLASVGSLLVSGVIAYTFQVAKGEVLRLRAEIAEARVRELEARTKEREEMRAWINGSFMRAAVVEARWTEIMHRIGELERHAEG